MTTCEAKNTWTDSGDRGAANHYHNQSYHPDHEHVWGPSTYDWEQAGENWIRPGDRTEVSIRTEADVPVRCTECSLAFRDDQSGKCGP